MAAQRLPLWHKHFDPRLSRKGGAIQNRFLSRHLPSGCFYWHGVCEKSLTVHKRPALLEITCFELGTPASQTMPNPGLTKPRIYEKLPQRWTDERKWGGHSFESSKDVNYRIHYIERPGKRIVWQVQPGATRHYVLIRQECIALEKCNWDGIREA